jgi:hypothetical protein
VVGPFALSLIANTSQGSMVGDYISCSVVAGASIALFAVGKTPTNGKAFDEAMNAVSGGLPVTGGAIHAAAGPTYPSATTPATGISPGALTRQ